MKEMSNDFKPFSKKIAIFYGGKRSKHLRLVQKAAEKMGVELDLISYNKVGFRINDELRITNYEWKKYEVIFFRTTGKHWEEVNLVVDWVKRNNPKCKIVDPLVLKGRPSDACKAWQMVELTRHGIEVPRTIYGSLWTLYEFSRKKSNFEKAGFSFPVVLKGSSGDRGINVFKADNLAQLERLVRQLRRSEVEEGRRYMLQEFIPNNGDYRILVLGGKVLGAVKRTSASSDEFRNNFSVGGKVEVVIVPESIKKLAIRATKICGLMVAGVDLVCRGGDWHRPVIWEINKGPQFWGFMQATGIDVPAEIVKFLVSL